MTVIRKMVVILLLLHVYVLQAQVLSLFSHGLIDTGKQAYHYAKTYTMGGKSYYNDRYFFDQPFVTFNYPDTRANFPYINYNETSLAQENEINQLKLAFEKTLTFHDDKVVIFGLSRGASAALNFMALHNPPQVAALLLESPFDAVSSIIEHKRKQLHLQWLPLSTGEYIVEQIFRRYKRYGIRPIDIVDNIRKDLPILIICSKQDQLVPYNSSIRLYQKLKDSGHQNIHLFVAQHGKHARISSDQDGDRYEAAVHAFYKKYNLPFNPKCALKEDNLL